MSSSGSTGAYAVLAQIDAESAKNGRFGAHLLPEFLRRLLDLRRPREDVESEWQAVLRTRPGLRTARVDEAWSDAVYAARRHARAEEASARTVRTLQENLRPAYRLGLHEGLEHLDEPEIRTRILEELAVVDSPGICRMHASWIDQAEAGRIHSMSRVALRCFYDREGVPADQRRYPRPILFVTPRTMWYTDGQPMSMPKGDDLDSSCGE